MQSGNYEIEPLVNAHCACGENPLWDENKKLVYWEDIPNGWIYNLDPATGTWEKIYDGDLVGGFTIQEDGRLLLFRDHNVAVLGDESAVQILNCKIEAQTGRFNDVIADPEGRVFAGTGGDAASTLACGLFRVDLNGSITKIFDGTTCSNGMGFSPDLKQLYWTDSTAKKIFVFDYDRATGDLVNRREFYNASEDAGIPDGMAVDAEGGVWSAHWDGYGIYRFDPDGKFVEKITLPVAKVSSLTFGGANWDEIYVTTAGGSARKNEPIGPDTPDGTLYRIHVDVQGRPEFRSRIAIPTLN